jgi:type IV secretion system protein VirB6
MPSPMLFQFIGETIDTALNTYVNTTAGEVVSTFLTLTVLLTTLYYVMNGLMIVLGKVDTPFSTFLLSCGKFLLISAFALNADMYLTWVVEAIRGLESALAASFSGSNGRSTTSVYAVIDDAFGRGLDLSAQLWEKAGNRGWGETGMAIGEYINSCIIALATIIISLPAGAMIVMAKTVLSIMLGIGPLFIMLLMWAPTQQFFDRWFSVVLTALFQTALLAAVLSFAIRAFLAFVEPIDIDSDQNPLFTSLQLLVISSVMLHILYAVNNYAAQLAGGISSAAITFGGMARSAADIASAPGRTAAALNKMFNPTSTHHDMKSGQMVKAGRLSHLRHGNTKWNPAYNQHIPSFRIVAF